MISELWQSEYESTVYLVLIQMRWRFPRELVFSVDTWCYPTAMGIGAIKNTAQVVSLLMQNAQN